ncbi:unnamed protein product [Cuscuta epithymum]|uniref:Uncharacterized protein n=1 Tax=Cuscuta epithymum TaxID=186058 RepID=A0AAV0ENW8_9ASTE|nr:unnamed protein product [Cuscuta epithymum]
MAKRKSNNTATMQLTLEKETSAGRQKLRSFLHSDPALLRDDHREENGDTSPLYSTAATNSPITTSTPSSPWSEIAGASPYTNSPWLLRPSPCAGESSGLIATLVRQDGHVYSLAASGNLLYTGSESKNIRVWNNHGFEEHSGFKSKSGFVKAIVVWRGKVFTGHQDGKIRVWKVSSHEKRSYTRIGSLPTLTDYLKSAINPKAYVAVRRHKRVPRVKHYDAVSCMSVDMSQGLLYSGSWDKTVKVWRLNDWKCIESIEAHDDAVNSVAVGFDGFVFSGSADGTVKAWRRELVGRITRHVVVDTLLNQESAVTSLAVNPQTAVYAGSSDGLVNFWDRDMHFVAYGGALRGHKLAVLCLAVAGNLVMSGSADKSICVWRRELEGGGGVHSCVTVLTGHTGPVKCLAAVEEDEPAERGGRRWRAYSGSLDKSVKVWILPGH